jgi:hypothetical protein
VEAAVWKTGREHPDEHRNAEDAAHRYGIGEVHAGCVPLVIMHQERRELPGLEVGLVADSTAARASLRGGDRRRQFGVWITPVLRVHSSKKNFGMCTIL